MTGVVARGTRTPLPSSSPGSLSTSEAPDASRRSASYRDEVTARLSEAARSGVPLELVFAVRGRVQPVAGKRGQRWRLRTGRGHVVTFRTEFVLAFNGLGQPLGRTRTVTESADPSHVKPTP